MRYVRVFWNTERLWIRLIVACGNDIDEVKEVKYDVRNNEFSTNRYYISMPLNLFKNSIRQCSY